MKKTKYFEKEVEFDEVADDYDVYLESLGIGSDTDKYAEYKVKLLRELVGTKFSSILDFGCGTGRLLKFIDKYFKVKKRGVSLYGCDVSQESINVAKKEVPEAILFRDTTPEEYEHMDMSYDLVFLACVFHHIPINERENWARAIYNKTNKGGYIAVFEHNLKNPFTKRIVSNPENKLDHVENMLSHKELKKLLLKSGNNTRLFWDGYTLFFPKRFKRATRIEKILKWCPLGAQHCVIIKKQ